MRKKRMLVFFGIGMLLIIGILAGVLFTKKYQKDNYVFECAIYPSGLDETYYFTLNQNGILQCDLGSRKNDDISNIFFMQHIETSSKIQLQTEELEAIFTLLDELEKISVIPEKQLWTDSWDISFRYHNKIYDSNYYESDIKVLDNIVNKIIELSPIAVDLHGWA